MMGTGAKFVKSLWRDLRRLPAIRPDFRHWDRQKLAWPFHVMTHPFAGMSDVKYENKGSAPVAALVLIGYFITNVLRFFYTGFIFNMSKTDEFNIVMELLSSVVLVLLWTVANWSVSTLMDGEGKFRDIWVVSCYAVTPKILTNLLVLFMSQFMVYTENVFLVTVDAAGTLWMGLLMVVGILVVHQYSLGKTILCCLVTIFGIAAILFMVILFISIVQQMAGFVNTVSVEILNRY